LLRTLELVKQKSEKYTVTLMLPRAG
jgi:hypothetical protein